MSGVQHPIPHPHLHLKSISVSDKKYYHPKWNGTKMHSTRRFETTPDISVRPASTDERICYVNSVLPANQMLGLKIVVS